MKNLIIDKHKDFGDWIRQNLLLNFCSKKKSLKVGNCGDIICIKKISLINGKGCV